MENRRSHPRLSHGSLAWYRFDHRVFRRCLLLDLSESGARVICPEPLPPHGEFHVTVPLSEGAPVTLLASMVWQRALGDWEHYRAGVRLVGGANDERLARLWVRRNLTLREMAEAAEWAGDQLQHLRRSLSRMPRLDAVLRQTRLFHTGPSGLALPQEPPVVELLQP